MLAKLFRKRLVVVADHECPGLIQRKDADLCIGGREGDLNIRCADASSRFVVLGFQAGHHHVDSCILTGAFLEYQNQGVHWRVRTVASDLQTGGAGKVVRGVLSSHTDLRIGQFLKASLQQARGLCTAGFVDDDSERSGDRRAHDSLLVGREGVRTGDADCNNENAIDHQHPVGDGFTLIPSVP